MAWGLGMVFELGDERVMEVVKEGWQVLVCGSGGSNLPVLLWQRG
jgi:hypothetical protein